MDKKATIYDYVRMCSFQKNCTDCPTRQVDCNLKGLSSEALDEINEIILRWCKEHPVKTRQDKFLEMFPKASTYNTIIDICPCKVDYNYNCKNVSGHWGEFDCCDCKKILLACGGGR